MNDLAKQELMAFFPLYMEHSTRLFAELEKIPSWQLIKYNRKLKEIGTLNDWYESKMREWGLS